MEQSFEDLIRIRDRYALEERKMYINYATKLNSLTDEALRNNYVKQFGDACLQDIVGQMIRSFLPSADMYVTADQIMKRVVTFSYKVDYDPLKEQGAVRTLAYNYDEISGIAEFVNNPDFITKLKLDRGIYAGKSRSSLSDYRKKVLVDKKTNTVVDELTGYVRPDQIQEGNNGRTTASLEGDHKVPISEAAVNEEFTRNIDAYIAELERIYNDKDNIWYIDEKANNIKGDISNPEDVIKAWETAKPEQKEVLRQRGYLDENGKVPEHIKSKLREGVESSRKNINVDIDKAQLRNLDVRAVGKHGLKKTAAAIPKMAIGQLLYYMLPPIVYETKCIIISSKEKKLDPESIVAKLEKAVRRIMDYTMHHVGAMFANLAHNTAKNFVRTVFDLVIALLKSFLRHFVRIAKTVVLSVLDSIRIITQENSSTAEKADSITNLFVLALTNVLIEIAAEYLELYGVPSVVMEAVQVLVSVVASNLVFILMEKLDLFDVRYGFKITKLEQILADISKEYDTKYIELRDRTQEEIDVIKNEIRQQISEIQKNMEERDFYNEDVIEDVERINHLFDMNIGFQKEWETFILSPIQ